MISKGPEAEWKGYMICSFSTVFMVLLVVAICCASNPVNKTGSDGEMVFSKGSFTRPTARNLLLTSNANSDLSVVGNGNDAGGVSPDRIGMGGESSCSDSILVSQGPSSPLWNHIPTYTVEIENVCVPDNCSVSDIHLSCGSFASARLLEPKVFRRIEYDDCLVNDGKPLYGGQALSFQYANTFMYPLAVSSASC